MSESEIGELTAIADPQFDPHAYTVVIRRVTLDGKSVFHGRVIELPDLEAFEPTHHGAYDFLIDGIESAKEAFDEQGRPFPTPLPEETPEYSGRVTIRMPKWLHQRLDFAAQMDGMSLNQHMVSILAYAMTPGWNTAVSQKVMVRSATNLFQELSTYGIATSGIGATGAAIAGITESISQIIQNVSPRPSDLTIRVASARPDYGKWHSNIGLLPVKVATSKKA